MSRIIFIGICILSSSILFSQTQSKKELVLLFAKDIDTLSEKEKIKLGHFIDNNTEQYIVSVNMTGHTDGDGSHSYNIDLSNRRTKHIKRLLQEHSVTSDIFSSNYFGEKKLLNQERNEIEKSQNRRVELDFTFIQARNIQDIVSTIQPDFHQTFQFSPEIKKLEVNGKKGTKLEIHRQDLVYEDGSPLGEKDVVNVKLNEIQSFMDQLQANISTETHDGRILESGGMFNVSLTSNDKELKLATGKEYKVSLPNEKRKTDMNVFTGVRDSIGQIKWQVTNQIFTPTSSKLGPRPSACIDENVLNKFEIKPKLAHFLNERTFVIEKPNSLEKPIAPRRTNEPDLMTGKRYFSLWQKITWTKRERNRIIDDINHRRSTYYEKKQDKFVEKNQMYIEKMLDFPAKEQLYRDQCKAYRDSIQAMYQYIENYKIARIETQYISQLKQRMKKMAKLSEKDSLFITNLNAYLFRDFMNLVEFYPTKFYQRINREFDLVITEYYGTNNVKEARVRFHKERESYYSQQIYTLGDWYRTANKPIRSYLSSKGTELMEKELISGYRSALDKVDLLYASLSSFSWINCDRFIRTSPNSMIAYRYEIPPVDNLHTIKTVVAMPSINSCLSVSNSFQLPKNQIGSLVSYYLGADKKIMLAKHEINPNAETNFGLEYKPVTLSEFSKELAGL